MNEKKLLAFIEGKLNPEEVSEVLEWIEKSEKNREEYNSFKNVMAISQMANDRKDNAGLLKTGADKILSVQRRKLVSEVIKYAAAVIIIAGITSLLFIIKSNSRENLLSSISHRIITPPGQSTDVLLADGSQVYLNSGSVLEYPVNFSCSEREIRLKGEAYFNVETDPEMPFNVIIGKFKIVAAGTSFNVDGYPGEGEVNITLVEGRVSVMDESGNLLTHIEPGQNLRVDKKNNSISKTDVDIGFYISWKDGKIKFKNRRLEDIAKDMERWYNVVIIFDDEKSRDIKYSGTILRNKPIDQVLEILRLTSDFNYEIEIDNDKKSIITIKK